MTIPMPTYTYQGAAIGLVVISSWVVSLTILLTVPFAWWMVALVPIQMFLSTGLFITAHDAMHGLVAPNHPSLNRAIGLVAVSLYAAFSYNKLHEKHHEHHARPGQPGEDPDFHDGEHRGFWRWYFHFILQYVTWVQVVLMAVAFNVLEHVFDVSAINLIVLWVIPSLLSTLQLFYFGTYLPHRNPSDDEDEHHAQSNDYAPWLSFLTCYHFGYHQEHHKWPYVPWWKLPIARNQNILEAFEADGVNVLIVFFLLLSACSATSMTPAHRLDTGEITGDLAVTEPGATFFPKLTAGGTVGAGIGDLSVQGSTSIAAVAATVAPRVYLGDRLELKLEGTYWTQFLANERLVPFSAFFGAARFGLSLHGDAGWFGGVQNVVLVPLEVADVSDATASPDTTVLLGGYGGYGWRSERWTFQFELSGSPIFIRNPEKLDLLTQLGATFQLGFSAHYWVNR